MELAPLRSSRLRLGLPRVPKIRAGINKNYETEKKDKDKTKNFHEKQEDQEHKQKQKNIRCKNRYNNKNETKTKNKNKKKTKNKNKNNKNNNKNIYKKTRQETSCTAIAMREPVLWDNLSVALSIFKVYPQAQRTREAY